MAETLQKQVLRSPCKFSFWDSSQRIFDLFYLLLTLDPAIGLNNGQKTSSKTSDSPDQPSRQMLSKLTKRETIPIAGKTAAGSFTERTIGPPLGEGAF